MLLIFWSSISFQKVWFFFSLVDKFNKLNYFPKQARGLKDSFISCSSMQLAYCQRSFYVLRSIRDVGVLFAFIFLSDEFECEMMEYFIRCLQWPEKLYYNKICCPGLIIWFMEALLGWIVIFFFFTFLNALSIYFLLKHWICERCRCGDCGESEIERTFLSPSSLLGVET